MRHTFLLAFAIFIGFISCDTFNDPESPYEEKIVINQEGQVPWLWEMVTEELSMKVRTHGKWVGGLLFFWAVLGMI